MIRPAGYNDKIMKIRCPHCCEEFVFKAKRKRRAPRERPHNGPPMNFVRMFKEQFAPLVKSGTKRQTVRPTPAVMPREGDTISLRKWSGKPYRSKQIKLREGKITKVERITIDLFVKLPDRFPAIFITP